MAESARIVCENCQVDGETTLFQAVVSGCLLWARSISCASCGRIEEDGKGFPPEDVRNHLLEANGTWRLIVERKQATLLKIIKDALGLGMEEISEQMKDFPCVYTGTRTEVEWLAEKLAAAGIASHAARMPS